MNASGGGASRERPFGRSQDGASSPQATCEYRAQASNRPSQYRSLQMRSEGLPAKSRASGQAVACEQDMRPLSSVRCDERG